jgi:tRNA-specific 2-thiouridylase
VTDTWENIAPGTRVVVAMSGGVDSSVAAAILVERECDVVGITMKNFCYSEVPEEYAAAACCSLEAIEDARDVARRLGIVHHVLDFEGPFRRAVIDPFVSEYGEGRTPNPCVRCNRVVRFPRLWAGARALGAEWVATGHHARVVCVAPAGPGTTSDASTEVELHRGADRLKDQSFYLWGLALPLLERSAFPIGNMTKDLVRDRARRFGLSTSEKPESQDICFIPDGDVRGFLRRSREERPELAVPDRFRPGPVVTSSGQRVGTHPGSAFFTVGQRRGIGIPLGEPHYVTEIGSDNTLIVGSREDLFRSGLEAEDVNWLVTPPEEAFDVRAQIRYRSGAHRARVDPGPGRTVSVRFKRSQPAIAPGQSVVFYDEDRVLGGGTITSSLV